MKPNNHSPHHLCLRETNMEGIYNTTLMATRPNMSRTSFVSLLSVTYADNTDIVTLQPTDHHPETKACQLNIARNKNLTDSTGKSYELAYLSNKQGQRESLYFFFSATLHLKLMSLKNEGHGLQESSTNPAKNQRNWSKSGSFPKVGKGQNERLRAWIKMEGGKSKGFHSVFGPHPHHLPHSLTRLATEETIQFIYIHFYLWK